MAQILFDRKIELTLGKRGEQGFIYRDLRIGFEVEKTLDSRPNKGFVKVYNLTRDNRSKAEQSGNVLILKAGYGTELETLFTGDVAKAKTELQGVDYVTTFELGDGEIFYNTAKSDISFAKGTDIKQAITSVLSAAKASLGDVTGLLSEKLQSSLVLSGNVRKHLDDIADRQNFEWSVQDDQVQIIGKGTATKEEAVFLSASTGLIGIPKNRFGTDNTTKGIEFDALLNGKIKAGRRVVIQSNQFQGQYRVERVKHIGDNFANEYYSKCEAAPV